MQKTVKSFANLMRDKLNQEQKYVLMLGAGASLSSGCSSGGRIIEEVVARYSLKDTTALSWDEKLEEFDDLLRNRSQDERYAMLEPHVRGEKREKPSDGYCCLAELIKEGYFDIIFSTNFDVFLEDALSHVGLRASDFKVLIYGEDDEEQMRRVLRSPAPRIKIVKLHGDLPAGILAFTPGEIFEFSDKVEALLEEYLSRDIIIAGHSMRDDDVNRCIRREGGAIWYVNPTEPKVSDYIGRAMRVRKSNVIAGELGKFDNFFTTLSDELRRMETEEKAIRLAGDLLELRERPRRLYIWKELHHLLHLLKSRFGPVDAGVKQKEPADDIEKALQPSRDLISDDLVPLAGRTEERDITDWITDLKQRQKEIDEALGSPLTLRDKISEFARRISMYLYRASGKLEEIKADLDALVERVERLREIENRLEDAPVALKELVGDMGDFIEKEGHLVEWEELHSLYKELQKDFEVIYRGADDLGFVNERWPLYRDTVLDKLAEFGGKIGHLNGAKTRIVELIQRGKEIDGALDSPELLREAIMKFNVLIGQHFGSTDEALRQTAATLDDLAARIQERIER